MFQAYPAQHSYARPDEPEAVKTSEKDDPHEDGTKTVGMEDVSPSMPTPINSPKDVAFSKDGNTNSKNTAANWPKKKG